MKKILFLLLLPLSSFAQFEEMPDSLSHIFKPDTIPVKASDLKALVLPLDYNGSSGFWMNKFAFEKTSTRLFNERNFQLVNKFLQQDKIRLQNDKKRIQDERDDYKVKYDNRGDELKQVRSDCATKQSEFNVALLKEKNKTLKVTIFGAGLAIFTWVLGKVL